MTPAGHATAAEANRHTELPARAGGYQFGVGASADLCPPVDAPAQPKAVSVAAAKVRAAYDALAPYGAAVRETRSDLPGAQFHGRLRAAEQKHEDAMGEYNAHLDVWRAAAVELARAVFTAKEQWLADLDREQKKLRGRALLALAAIQDDCDQLDAIEQLARGIGDVHAHGQLGGIRLSAAGDMPLRLEQRQRQHERDRELTHTMVASDIDSLLSALDARLQAPQPGSEPQRAAW